MSDTPWEYHAKLTASENHRGYSITEGSTRIADVMPIDEDGIKGKEYASRMVACVNALAGVSTDWLEKYTAMGATNIMQDNATLRAALQTQAEEAAKLMQQRDELLDALCVLQLRLESCSRFPILASDSYDSFYQEIVESAITNATNPT